MDGQFKTLLALYSQKLKSRFIKLKADVSPMIQNYGPLSDFLIYASSQQSSSTEGDLGFPKEELCSSTLLYTKIILNHFSKGSVVICRSNHIPEVGEYIDFSSTLEYRETDDTKTRRFKVPS